MSYVGDESAPITLGEWLIFWTKVATGPMSESLN